MSIGTPLSLIQVFPSLPNTAVDDVEAPDAAYFRQGLYDARRELFRARGAILDNCVIGGFRPTLAAGVFHLGPGIVQFMIPRAGWSATPASGQLYVATPVAGSGVDGAIRCERTVTTNISVGDGTTGPLANTDSLVYLKYNQSATDRFDVKYVAIASAGAVDWSSAVPVAWVRTTTTVFWARDCRVLPPGLPRVRQARYPTPDPPDVGLIVSGGPLVSPIPGEPYVRSTIAPCNEYEAGPGTLLPNTDIGSFWLRDGEAILFYVGVQFSGIFTQESLLSTSNLEIQLSRGDPNDSPYPFLAGHGWFGGDRTHRIFPLWWASMPMVGDTLVGVHALFVPHALGTQTVPGIYHFNGIYIPYLFSFGTIHPILNIFRPVRWAIVKAEVVRRGSRAFAGRRTDVEATSFPEIPTVV